MRVTLSARGSRGDVGPVIAMAAALQRRGHQLRILVPARFTALARACGLGETWSYEEDSEQVMRGLGAGLGGVVDELRWLPRNIAEQFRLLTEATRDADALVTTINEVAAASVAEGCGVPHYRVTYAPFIPGSQSLPLLPWQGLPPRLNRFLWWGLNRSAGLSLARPLQRGRRALGLPPLRCVSDHLANASHTLLAYSAALSPPPADWSARRTFVGYCPLEVDEPLDPELARFLAEGPPPVYLGFGSVMIDPERTTRRILRAVELAGCRAVLHGGWAGLGSGASSRAVCVVGDTRHRALFPRLAGVVHHGGSGTTHEVLRAGVPQVVAPQLADQYHWAHRVHALGLGPSALRGRFTARQLARTLQELAQNPIYRARARVMAEGTKGDRGADAVAELLEREHAVASSPIPIVAPLRLRGQAPGHAERADGTKEQHQRGVDQGAEVHGCLVDPSGAGPAGGAGPRAPGGAPRARAAAAG